MKKNNFLAVFSICCFLSGAPLGFTETITPPVTGEPFWQRFKDTFSGYYKMLTTFSRTRDTDEPYYAALQRLRLEIKPKITERCELDIVYDHELLLHDFRNSSDFSLIRQKNQKNLAFWDADQVISDTDHVYERQLLYRAFLKYDFENSRLTMGKQLIDWGRMRFYSPLDLFNQPLPSDIETDERVGFDAVNYEFFGGDFWGWSALYGPERNSTETSFGLRFTTKIGTYDTFAIAAKHEKEKVAGFGWDGYVGDAGFRGEFTYTKNGRDTYARAAVGCDYSFWRKLYAIIEYFYNGAADGNVAAFASNVKLARDLLSIRKQLVSLMARYEATPLFQVRGSVIYDIEGKSVFLNPELRYNIFKNSDAICGAQLFAASSGSEFDGYKDLYYIEFKHYF
ncbi:MAG: hypothetical protein PHH75_05760 [Candidatus Omnitrophica bacterium]|nr:hypothetical protein [Candidatus Omnitrophota bacterium]MDD5574667.1 hypothetical protein [Candidatus Omnitrophota bacterium]